MLYQDNTAKLVGLKDVIVKQVDEEKNRHSITIELPRKVHECPQCGCQTRAIHDYRMLNIRDLNAFGKQTILRLRKRRYRCPDCGKRFYGENSFSPKVLQGHKPFGCESHQYVPGKPYRNADCTGKRSLRNKRTAAI